MITSSNSPVLGSGMPNHYGGDLLHTMAISGLSRVRTELFKLTVVQTMSPQTCCSPSQIAEVHKDLARHSRRGCRLSDQRRFGRDHWSESALHEEAGRSQGALSLSTGFPQFICDFQAFPTKS
jgi:hypothetical protein